MVVVKCFYTQVPSAQRRTVWLRIVGGSDDSAKGLES